jgi:hypothetical protein
MYVSHKHLYQCAPSHKECEALRSKSEEGLYSAATEICEIAGPEQIEIP